MAEATGAAGAGKRVLILSASSGAGHLRAADALLQDFKRRPEVETVEHWDMLKYTTKIFRHIYSRLYLDLVNKAPGVLGYVYDRTDTPWKNEASRLAFEKFNSLPFLKAMREFKPDLVVCTHFTPPFLLSNLVERKKMAVRPAIVITDLDCHAMWLVRHYLHYFCALDETRAYLERMGISPSRITVSGIPVDPVFRTEKEAGEMRRKLGLAAERFTLLVSAGGFGVGPIELLIKELTRLQGPAQVVAIAGRSEELKTRLDKLAAEHGSRAAVRIVPVGFTKQMDEYMAAADMLISKPGGLTTSEAMARGLPMCIANPIPGQEERNADHLLEAGVAIRCNNLPTLAWKLQKLIDTPGRFEKMRAAARQFGRPWAGDLITRTLLEGTRGAAASGDGHVADGRGRAGVATTA